MKYRHLTDKGRFTYDFFELRKMEIDALNTAQDIDGGTQLSAAIPEAITRQLENLIGRL